MRTLTDIFKQVGNFGQHLGWNDKGSLHSYLEVYDKLFFPFKSGCSFMEIGLAKGDSLKMWDEYFEKSIIVGVDNDIDFEEWEYKNDVTLLEADATTDVFSAALQNEYFDIIVDDATHKEEDQIKTFNLLNNKMKKNGVYIIEDISNIDKSRIKFEGLHKNCETVDMRRLDCPDNCLIIFYF